MIFDLPKRKLVVEQGEKEGRRAGTEGRGQQVAEWKAAFTTEDKRQNDENDGAEENRLEIQGEIDACEADEHERIEPEWAAHQLCGRHGRDVVLWRSVGVEETDDIGDWKIEFHREEPACVWLTEPEAEAIVRYDKSLGINTLLYRAEIQ